MEARARALAKDVSEGVKYTSQYLVKLMLWLIAAAFISMVLMVPARAQTTTSYVVNNTGTIGGGQSCTGSSPLVRNFSVADNFTIADVDLGVFATHFWRGDIRITLRSPAGTEIQLVDGDVNLVSGDNFNVRLNDSGTQTVNTDGNTATHSTATPPPFQHNFIPNSALSAFNGENSQGTWRMEICDAFPNADNGVFRYAELFLTSSPSNFSDLSLTKSVSNATPVAGASISYTLVLNNAGNVASNNVEVLDQLPLGFNYVSSSGFGSYNPGTGIWSVPTIASGQSRSITIAGTVDASNGVTVTNTAEVFSAPNADLDSTPNNGANGEDDFAQVSFTVQGARAPGVPPVLSCPVGTTVFDWDAPGIQWSAGSLNQTFNIANFGDVNFAITNQGTFENDANFGGQNPAESGANTGGLSGGQSALHQFIDFSSDSQVATTVITLPNAIPGAQFTIFDVDFAANDFADLVTVTGRYQGATVIPVLTNGIANYIVGGNTAIGDATSGNTSGNGNVEVTFNQPIDSITITYGNGPGAPPVPDGQAIAIHDFDFCSPQTSLSVTKVSSIVADPINGSSNAKAIPGATVEYLISVSNTGISNTDPDSVVVTDDHPADIKLCRLNQAGGPVTFNDPGGNSGLNFAYSGLGVGTDDLEFSNNNGASFTYTPVDDGDGCDSNITDFRLNPSGAMASGSTFTIRVRYQIID